MNFIEGPGHEILMLLSLHYEYMLLFVLGGNPGQDRSCLHTHTHTEGG